jgi:hypothetical protein
VPTPRWLTTIIEASDLAEIKASAISSDAQECAARIFGERDCQNSGAGAVHFDLL